VPQAQQALQPAAELRGIKSATAQQPKAQQPVAGQDWVTVVEQRGVTQAGSQWPAAERPAVARF